MTSIQKQDPEKSSTLTMERYLNLSRTCEISEILYDFARNLQSQNPARGAALLPALRPQNISKRTADLTLRFWKTAMHKECEKITPEDMNVSLEGVYKQRKEYCDAIMQQLKDSLHLEPETSDLEIHISEEELRELQRSKQEAIAMVSEPYRKILEWSLKQLQQQQNSDRIIPPPIVFLEEPDEDTKKLLQQTRPKHVLAPIIDPQSMAAKVDSHNFPFVKQPVIRIPLLQKTIYAPPESCLRIQIGLPGRPPLLPSKSA